jgi:hypothetical protein
LILNLDDEDLKDIRDTSENEIDASNPILSEQKIMQIIDFLHRMHPQIKFENILCSISRLFNFKEEPTISKKNDLSEIANPTLNFLN